MEEISCHIDSSILQEEIRSSKNGHWLSGTIFESFIIYLYRNVLLYVNRYVGLSGRLRT